VYRKRQPEEMTRDEWAEIRAHILERDHFTCQRCENVSKTGQGLQPHHIMPRSEGGSNDSTNLIALCTECHNFVEVEGYKTKAEIIAYEQAPIERLPIKESSHEYECDKTRPSWHTWVYGGGQRP
jgi:5-methylcytosine-specific restriction endonuclease McrA